MISLPFRFNEEWENAKNISFGIGSGIFSSILVTAIVNKENDAREKRRLQSEKIFLLNDIITSSLNVYEDTLYRINEYITLNELKMENIYELYNDFKPYNIFANHLTELSTTIPSDKEKESLNELFKFETPQMKSFISNLRHLPRHEYYSRGILTNEEYKSLIGTTANDEYLKWADQISTFWDEKYIDLDKCIQFLRMTIFIASKTISTFDNASKQAKKIEVQIKDNIANIEYEMYLQSDEYIESQIEEENARLLYYAEHPEELDKFENNDDFTNEDWVLGELNICILGFSENNITDVLDKLDKNSPKLKMFFKQTDVREKIRNTRKLKSIIKTKYGKEYLNEILNLEDENNG